jgi:RND family efflux transporter MFP subunit
MHRNGGFMDMHPSPGLRRIRNKGVVVSSGVVLFIVTTIIFKPEVDEYNEAGTIPGEREIPSPVRIAVVRRDALISCIEISGMVRARRSVDVSSRISGNVVAMRVHNGLFVQAGDTLALLDDSEYRLVYENARTALLVSQIEYQTLSTSEFLGGVDSAQLAARIEAAHRSFESVVARTAVTGVPPKALDRARRDHETTIAYLTANRGDVIAGRSGLYRYQSEFLRARLDLEGAVIRAPCSGRVANDHISTLMHVEPGTMLCTILDMSEPEVAAEILETDISRIAVGQEAEISVMALSGKVFRGMVKEINPLVDSDTRGVKVVIRFADWTRYAVPTLKPGMYATSRIRTHVINDRLLVPREAILVRDGRTLVFLARSGKAEWRYVSTGGENEEYIDVLSGIEEGDSVMIDGHQTLVHQARILVVE